MNVRDSDSSGSPSPEPKRQRIADIDWASAPPWQYEWWVGARVMAQFVGRVAVSALRSVFTRHVASTPRRGRRVAAMAWSEYAIDATWI